jgi:hypothetical protein
MIKYITSTGRYIDVGGGSSATNYINSYSGAQGVGNLRFNTSNQTMEVYDGMAWIMLNMGHSSIGLNREAEELLDWARKKRDEEIKLSALDETHPAVKIALDNLKKAKEQLDVTIILSKEHNESTS